MSTMTWLARKALYLLPLLLLGGGLSGCASNPGQAAAAQPAADTTAVADEHPYKNQRTPRCQSGHTLQCEVRRTGRIRFSGFRKKNLENCACAPYEGAPLQSAIPGLERAH